MLEQPKPAKSCGGCTMCCKLPAIQELNKPMNQWCAHCKPGSGCKIYEARPDICRGYMCAWLDSPSMPDRYRPDRVKIIISATTDPYMLQAMVDPAYPGAWQTGLGKELIDNLLKSYHVVVVCGDRRKFLGCDRIPLPKNIENYLHEIGVVTP